jgi:hypothetical protein
MAEDGVVKMIPLERCTSRSQELQGVKNMRDIVMTADVSSDHRIRTAYLRRSLAFDQAGLISFDTHEGWINHLFAKMFRPVPSGFASTSIGQVMLADHELFVRMGEICRSGIAAGADGKKPMDEAMKSLQNDPDIAFHTLPCVAYSRAPPHNPTGGTPPPPGVKRNPEHEKFLSEKKAKKAAAKAKARAGKGDGKGKRIITMPLDLKGMSSHVDDDEVCFNYQRGKCSAAPDGGKCPRGVHKCCKPKCGKNHSLKDHPAAVQ